jgi:hypothetical protein
MGSLMPDIRVQMSMEQLIKVIEALEYVQKHMPHAGNDFDGVLADFQLIRDIMNMPNQRAGVIEIDNGKVINHLKDWGYP